MTTRRWIALGVLLPMIAGGCGGKVQTREFQSAPPQSAQPALDLQPARQGDRMDANAGSAGVLAQKTQSYAREVGALADARSGKSSVPPSPSQVQWMEEPWPTASDLRLGDMPIEPTARRAADPDMVVRPIIDTTPVTANQPAEAASPRTPGVAPKGPDQSPSSAANPGALAAAESTLRLSPPMTSTISTDNLTQRMESQLKNSPRDVWLNTEYQLLRLMKDDPAPDMATLAGLPQEDRELVTAIVDGMTNFRNAIRQDANMLLSAKVRPLLEMADRLRSQSELTIPKLVLCRKMETYGVYDPIDPARFTAGTDANVVVYCEIANFMSSLGANQMWETQFQWDMTLFTEQSIPVWSDKTESVTDQSRSKRHDQILGKLITLPKSLPVGRYLLKVTIVDKQSNRIAEATAPLVIVAQ